MSQFRFKFRQLAHTFSESGDDIQTSLLLLLIEVKAGVLFSEDFCDLLSSILQTNASAAKGLGSVFQVGVKSTDVVFGKIIVVVFSLLFSDMLAILFRIGRSCG